MEASNIYVVCDAGDPHIRHIHYSLEEPTILKSPLQMAVIAHTVDYGPSLFLGADMEHLAIQSTLADEALYHRPFVHGAAALCMASPRSALVIGGGEGGMAREVLKYSTIGIIDQVDWDAVLLDYFKQPAVAALWNDGAYEDPRLRLHVEDAFSSRAWEGRTYDLILIDLCDPDAESIEGLKELARRLQSHLNAGGVLLMNAGAVLPRLRESPGILKTISYSEELLEFMEGMMGESHQVFSYKLYVPSYYAPWCLIGLAPKKGNTYEGCLLADWTRPHFSEEELTDILHYEIPYSEKFRSVNKGFLKERFATTRRAEVTDIAWGC
jgi:spermidine synthase